jgi:hypothetical protein
MGLWSDKPKEEKKADLNRYKATKKALENSKKVVREECPAFWQLNSAVIEAEQEIPWWRR